MPADRRSPLRRAVTEALEGRRLLAFTGANYDLPLRLDFSAEVNGVADADGQNVGFPVVQGNSDGDEYQPSLIDLDTAGGVLRLISAGDAADGSNFGDDNSLVNGLQVPFDATQPWVVHTRLTGDLTDYDQAFEQAGLLVGPTQDDYVKLVFGNDGSDVVVQFLAESGGDSFPLGEAGAKSVVTGVQGVNLARADFVDLWLSGDPSTGEITAQYRVDGGLTVRFDEAFTTDNVGFFRAGGARAGILAAHKNDGDPIVASFDAFDLQRGDLPSAQPTVREARPNDGDGDVFRDAFVAVDLTLPNSSVDDATLTADNVRLVNLATGAVVPAGINTTGGGDSIILTPDRALDANQQYRFEIDSGVTDLFGVPFVPFTSTFTTNFSLGNVGDLGSVAFDTIDLPDTQGTIWSSVTLGPDGRLYATSITGQITRWEVESDGTLGSRDDITTLMDAEGGPRVTTGLAFGPDSEADDLVAYVTHTEFNDVTTDMPDDLGNDFTGKISRLSGVDLEDIEDLVVGLPRSVRDHLTNQPAFGPDGRLYLGQGANNAMGAPDAAWGDRPERLLSGAVLAVDVEAIEDGGEPLDVATGPAGDYDPDADDAPVVVYAGGVRNSYNVLWHSNGNLYAPTNGSAAGGNTPAAPDGSAPSLFNVQQTQNDYLFNVEQGGYYGHPNPTQGHYVLNGGNPTAGDDPAQVNDYPVGTLPDPDYRGFAYDFGKNISPNGAIEYRGDAFDGALDGALIVTRWSGGDDLIVLTLDDDGDVVNAVTGLPGTSGFVQPLDLVQSGDGSIYLAQYGEPDEPDTQRITLLRPIDDGGEARVPDRRVPLDAAVGESTTRPFTVRNAGDEPLVLSGFTLGLVGEGRSQFEFVDAPAGAVTVEPGDEFDFTVQFNAPDDADVGDTFTAIAYVRTSDPDAPEVGATFTGLVKRGEDGANEPSLQDVLDAYGLGIETGDSDPTTTEFAVDEILDGDGIAAGVFEPADPDRPVAFETIAVYSPPADPTLSWGYYDPSRPQDRTTLSEVLAAQSLAPEALEPDKFSPDTPGERFGLYLESPVFLDDGLPRVVYSDPALNDFEPVEGERRKFVAFPIDGVDDAYAVTFEEFENETDYNDLVIVMRNVRPVLDTGPRLATIDPSGVPMHDRAVFSTIADDRRDDRFGQQRVRDVRTITLVNTGDAAATIGDVTATGPFDVTDSPSGTTLAAGDSTTVTIEFNATGEGPGDGLYEETLTIDFGDDDLTLGLAGYYMPYSEDDVANDATPTTGDDRPPNEEPTLEEIVATFGYATDVGTDAQRQTGTPDAVGDEILSAFWRAAEPSKPVVVTQLAAYHNTEFDDEFYWYPREAATSEAAAESASNLVLEHQNTFAQSMLPAPDGGDAGDFAQAAFSPGTAEFGVRVVNEYSVDDFNDDNFGDGGDDLHLFRFYPARQPDGDLIPNTYIAGMDFIGFNFDYNDNVYLLQNAEPADLAPAPVALTVGRFDDGQVGVYWANPAGVDRVRLFVSEGGRDDFGVLDASRPEGFYVFEDVDDLDGPVFVRVQSIGDDGTLGGFDDIRVA